MQRFTKSLIVLILAFMAKPALSQQVSVTASIDSSMILIGQQSGMHIKVSGPTGLNYSFPQFPGDTLVNGIELLARGPVDTVEITDGQIQLNVDYLITSFDSGLYYIPPIKVLAGLDTVESDFMALKVLTYDVDTTKTKLYDIKGVEAPPFVLSDYLLYIIIFILVYCIALLVIWLILKKKYGIRTDKAVAVQQMLPPHVRAIMELDKLKSEKPWKDGKTKEFFTRLSDILRTYINQRFNVNAMEMTSSEILDLFSKDRNTQSIYQNLKQILQLADLVKFAKVTPIENENELSIMNSYLFVNQTKLEDIQSVEEQKEALLEQQQTESETVGKPDDDGNDYMKKFQRK